MQVKSTLGSVNWLDHLILAGHIDRASSSFDEAFVESAVLGANLFWLLNGPGELKNSQ